MPVTPSPWPKISLPSARQTGRGAGFVCTSRRFCLGCARPQMLLVPHCPGRSLRARRTQAVSPHRATPFFAKFTVPGSHVPYNARTTLALDRKAGRYQCEKDEGSPKKPSNIKEKTGPTRQTGMALRHTRKKGKKPKTPIPLHQKKELASH